MTMAKANLSIIVTAVGALKAAADIGKVDKSVQALGRRSLGSTIRNIERIGILAAGAAVGAGAAAVKMAADYEQAFAGVRKTVEATDAELQRISKDILAMSTTIPIAATELARLGETAGALGVESQSIAEFVRITALLGETTDLTADQAATGLGVLQNVLKLTAAEYSKVGSTLVDLGNKGASTESAILEVAQRAGAAGKLIGLAAPQILAYSSAVASLGIEPEAAGSSLQNFFLRVAKATAAGKKDMTILAKTAGMTGAAWKKAWATDASGALQAFLAGLGKLKQGDQLEVLDQV